MPALPLKSITLSLVEDDPGVRESLASVLDGFDRYRCLSHYPDGESALKGIPLERPDVVLMDINLPGMSGVDCVRELKSSMPTLQILMLTVYENSDLIFKALAAGASGYLLKQTPLPKLLEAIDEVHQGGSPMTSHIARKVVQSFQQLPRTRETDGLSPREQAVLECLAEGYLYKEIAVRLQISYETVHTYIRRIYEKLHVRSRTEAVAKFLRN